MAPALITSATAFALRPRYETREVSGGTSTGDRPSGATASTAHVVDDDTSFRTSVARLPIAHD
jgi:hypothetical protein